MHDFIDTPHLADFDHARQRNVTISPVTGLMNARSASANFDAYFEGYPAQRATSLPSEQSTSCTSVHGDRPDPVPPAFRRYVLAEL